jgi:hypothetical protein
MRLFEKRGSRNSLLLVIPGVFRALGVFNYFVTGFGGEGQKRKSRSD